MAGLKKRLSERLGRAILARLRAGQIPRALAYPGLGLAFWLLGAEEAWWQYPPEFPMYCRAIIYNRGPVVSGLSVKPSGTGKVRVKATLRDTVGGKFGPDEQLRGVGGGVAWVDSLPAGYAGGIRMSPADGKFGSDSEEVFLDLDISGEANHRVYVAGWDQEGLLGYPDSVDLEVRE